MHVFTYAYCVAGRAEADVHHHAARAREAPRQPSMCSAQLAAHALRTTRTTHMRPTTGIVGAGRAGKAPTHAHARARARIHTAPRQQAACMRGCGAATRPSAQRAMPRWPESLRGCFRRRSHGRGRARSPLCSVRCGGARVLLPAEARALAERTATPAQARTHTATQTHARANTPRVHAHARAALSRKAPHG